MNVGAQGIVIIGAGPAGLMAAEVLSSKGLQVDVYDAMPSVGRKFLLAGKGGLNLTHSESFDQFITRYGSRQAQLAPMLDAAQGGFGAQQVRDWAAGLGIDTFVGTSGRVFPKDMKAAPLLRAWLHRLRANGVRFHMRSKWTGWNAAGELMFDTPQGKSGQTATSVACSLVILALGGASWKRLGSDGAWAHLLQARAIDVAPLMPSNCGFDVAPAWSEHFKSRFAGQPLKTIAINGKRGEFVITETGVEGSLIYALSSQLRDAIAAQGHATLHLDLLPDFSLERVQREIEHPRGSKSLSSHLKSRLGLDGVKMGLLHERLPRGQINHASQLAKACKALPIRLASTRPIDEAISTAGGVRFESMTSGLMLRQIPNVFCAGEMLDWEAPTGGYLLNACLASGRTVALEIARMMHEDRGFPPTRE
ncbi:MAG: TIGR03862 family flavoprotein [Cytophagales bacterium]|nr:TIGR03862 family flavoprotein [Cytophagales bacterium]